MNWRRMLFEIVEPDKGSSVASRIFDWVITALILLSVVIMSAGKPVCFLTGELLKGTSNPASFFAEYGADWVSANNGQQFSTFRIS